MTTENTFELDRDSIQGDLVPLVLDVDDALLLTDLLHETAVAYLKMNPLGGVFQMARWLMKGKAVLKRELSLRVALALDNLPVNEELVSFARAAHAQGRKVGLATAADQLLALRLARRFDFVSFVIASDGLINLKGANKAAALTAKLPGGFAYAGDSKSDLPVWGQASAIILSGASAKVAGRARLLDKPIEAEFDRPKLGLRGWSKALRVHQWAKNVLVFVPLVLSGLASHPIAGAHAVVAFLAMSLMASGTYLLNDLFDLADDRAHWTKRERPLASGKLRIKHGVAASAALVVASLALAASLGLPSLALIVAYMATTLGYSFYLKRQPIVDVFALGALFTMRLGLGIVAVGAAPSAWLLVFSMFLFTSLSFAKRQTEIQRGLAKGLKAIGGRGYLATDAALVLAMGVATGMTAVTIMVLYIMNDAFSATFYREPVFLWVFPAVLFMWISRIWLVCHREQLNDDPVAFAIRDRLSIFLGAAMGAAFLAGWLL